MIKMYLTLFLTFCSICMFSQNEERDQFVKFCMQKMELERAAIGQQDYVKGESIALEVIAALDNASEELKAQLGGVQGDTYYNLACYQSMQGKIDEAISSFEKAIEFGFVGYKHAMFDSDLDSLRKDDRFRTLMDKLREKGDFIHVLQIDGGYENSIAAATATFTYLDKSDANLVRVREYFNLDSIAGNGDEISQIKNLLYWAHNVVRHDGNSMNPKSRNAIDIVEICKNEDRGVNCRMMAQMLNECYLALGFKARYVTCMPKVYVNDCHVINTVYSQTLNKWIWVDPTFNAFVTDENDNLLSIAEVRERLRTGETLVLNEDANWNNKNKQTKEQYLDNYMAKNLYYVECILDTGYNTEPNKSSRYISLYPTSSPQIQNKEKTGTDNADWFWQKPL